MDDLQAYFTTLNLQQEGTQRMQVNGFDVTVTATLVEPIQQGRSTAGGLSNFDLGLYDVDVDVRKNDRLIGQYLTRLAGYRRVRITNVSPN